MKTDFKLKNLFAVIIIFIFSLYLNVFLNSIRTDDFDYTKWGVVILGFSLVSMILYIVDVFVLKSIDVIYELKQNNKAVGIVIAAIILGAAIILAP
ncbi:MAG TPA: hypothetical protein PKI46_09710 [Bacteroidales bacterium]|nr:hypothetical protein [Bacteroidales bacterium]